MLSSVNRAQFATVDQHEKWSRTLAAGAVLALPLFLLHGRVVADALIVIVAVLFLERSVFARDWAWLRAPWVVIGGTWWAWQLACSVPEGPASWTQGLVLVRFLLFVAALEHWVLQDRAVRRWLARLLQWAALYLALQSLLQFATGRNLQGYPRSGDGELTGPYEHPRAGPPLSRLLFPAVLPLTRLRWPMLLIGVAVVLLIGQRMPLLLTLLGLFTTALFMPRLRPVVMAAVLMVGAMTTAASVVSPPTFYRLVTKFSAQMTDFPDSPYGLIARRSLAIGRAHPVTGRGADAFRRVCADPAYFQLNDPGGAATCVQHPHNHYLEALDDAGLPGLALFSALVLAWSWRLGTGLVRDPDPLRVGLFVAVLIHEWPIASASSFTSMPLSGWFFVLLGLGLAETRAYISTEHAKAR